MKFIIRLINIFLINQSFKIHSSIAYHHKFLKYIINIPYIVTYIHTQSTNYHACLQKHNYMRNAQKASYMPPHCAGKYTKKSSTRAKRWNSFEVNCCPRSGHLTIKECIFWWKPMRISATDHFFFGMAIFRVRGNVLFWQSIFLEYFGTFWNVPGNIFKIYCEMKCWGYAVIKTE